MASKSETCIASPICNWPETAGHANINDSHIYYDTESIQAHDIGPIPRSPHSPSDPAAASGQGNQPQSPAGSLSLHNYRKFLSQDDESMLPDTSHGGKTLKRKYGAVNLQQGQTRPSPSYTYPVSVSSAASSPPPLSPSYSMSVMSQSEQELDRLDGFLLSSSPLDMNAEYPVRAKSNTPRLNTFRDRLEPLPSSPTSTLAPPSYPSPSHAKTHSDSILLDLKQPPSHLHSQSQRQQSKPTLSHHGALFEILNPRDSLKLSRIVSYIEDVDRDYRSSAESAAYYGDSRFSAATASTVLGVEEEERSPVLEVDDLLVLTGNGPAQENGIGTPGPPPPDVDVDKDGREQAQRDLFGDAPYTPIQSISERLQGNTTHHNYDHIVSPPPYTSSPKLPSETDSDIGEPGPIFEHDDYPRTWQHSPHNHHHYNYNNQTYLTLSDIDIEIYNGYCQTNANLEPQPDTPIKHISPSAQRKIHGRGHARERSISLRRLRSFAGCFRKGRFSLRGPGKGD